ncbi:adenosylcobalamin-dependent ribonucleoside-diphosphate reductase [Micromonospora sp. NPDC049301]|uniref:adenosylcobalamin-dependent ribonucleoside-diphosphate reductase n=1 Tax=Micromonospora sp. NPDC049301 TaxID=3155723 RepID=UPI003448A0FD
MPVQTSRLFESALHELRSTRTRQAAFSQNAQLLLQERYLARDADGQVTETPEAMLRRVARALARAEQADVADHWEAAFYEVMARLEFHPGSRTLANAGTRQPQLANCFVFPVEDSQESVLRTFSESSIVKSYGGGCGFNYSNIRPRGDEVRGNPGLAIGPVALLKLFDDATKLFRQRGRYESGNMAILDVDHPDVLDFVTAKRVDGLLSMTNISLGVTDAFMRAVEADAGWTLVNRRTGAAVRTLPARELFAAACELACETGDPGLIFLDNMNRNNPLRDSMGDIVATNPCGEIGLYPYEACNLGYVNLPRLLLPADRRNPDHLFDLDRLRVVMAAAVRMIDDAISESWFPVAEIREAVQGNRRIGIGVTGWAESLALAGIPYDSEEALSAATVLARSMREFAYDATVALARERGPFPNVHRSIWKDAEQQPRNVAVLAMPPSGNNAVIFDTSFSIEPFFAMSYTQRVFGGREIRSVNRLLLRELAAHGVDEADLLQEIAENGGGVQGLSRVPEDVQRVYRTAHDITPEWHVRMQAAFQEHVDNAVTKTVNLPRTATAEQVAALYQQAWRLGCKGITVYRDASRADQAIEATRPSAVVTAPVTTTTSGVACDPADGTCAVCE